MSDALASVSDNRRRRGRDWGLSPTIERQRRVSDSASREPKKPLPPVAATKPAPEEVVTIAELPAGTLFRIVTDLDGIKEAFADRIEDLRVALTEVDAAGQMTRGQMQKCLADSNKSWAREFGWKSLHKALTGTGMALVFVINSFRAPGLHGPCPVNQSGDFA